MGNYKVSENMTLIHHAIYLSCLVAAWLPTLLHVTAIPCLLWSKDGWIKWGRSSSAYISLFVPTAVPHKILCKWCKWNVHDLGCDWKPSQGIPITNVYNKNSFQIFIMQVEIIKSLIILQILVYNQTNPEVRFQRMNFSQNPPLKEFYQM